MSIVPYTNQYFRRKEDSNIGFTDFIKSKADEEDKIVVLDDFDRDKKFLNTSKYLVHFLKPSNIYVPNYSKQVASVGKKMGLNAECSDLFSFLKKQKRFFRFAYFDSCGSLQSLKNSIDQFVGANMVTNKTCILACVFELNRTSGTKDHTQFLRDYVYNDLCRVLPYCFQEPTILLNLPDISNKMHNLICELKLAEYPHHSHLKEGQKQQIYNLKTFEEGYVLRKKQFVHIKWDTGFVEKLLFSDFKDEFTTVMPETTKGDCVIKTHELLNTKIVRTFNKKKYVGIVDRVVENGKRTFFHVKYEDQDEEEMSFSEVKRFRKI